MCSSGVIVTGQRLNPDEVPDGWGIRRQFGVCRRIDAEMAEDSESGRDRQTGR